MTGHCVRLPRRLPTAGDVLAALPAVPTAADIRDREEQILRLPPRERRVLARALATRLPTSEDYGFALGLMGLPLPTDSPEPRRRPPWFARCFTAPGGVGGTATAGRFPEGSWWAAQRCSRCCPVPKPCGQPASSLAWRTWTSTTCCAWRWVAMSRPTTAALLDRLERQRLSRPAHEESEIHAHQPGPDDATTQGTPAARAVAVPLVTIERREIDWLWTGWLPRGCVVTVAGEPGAGKSYLMAAVATAITKGTPLPGDVGKREPANVLLVASEDDEGAVLRPRFDELGADLARLYVKTEVEVNGDRRPLTLPRDGALLAALVQELHPALVIVDPLVAVEDPGIDTHRQAGQRAVFAPLLRLAADLNCAVVAVRHTRKGAAENPNHRIMGSVDAVAAARVVWLVGSDPETPGRRGVAVGKSNLGEFPEPRGFSIEAGRFSWERDAAPDLTAHRLFGPPADSCERSARDEATEFLRSLLADKPKPAREVYRKAKDAGLSERTIDRAKATLSITSRKDGEKWVWALPEGKGATAPLRGNGGTLGTLAEDRITTGISRRAPRVPQDDSEEVYRP